MHQKHPKPILYFLTFLLILPIAFSITLDQLISSYDFSYAGAEINVTNITSWGNDTNANGLFDYLIINVTTANQGGNYTVAADLYYEDSYITSAQTSQWLTEGNSTVMLYFNPKLLTKTRYNLSLSINKNYLPVYRKEDAYTINFNSAPFEKPDVAPEIASYSVPDTRTLRVTVNVNSTKDKTYNITGYLTGSNVTITAKNVSALANGANTIQLNFNGSEIRKKRLNESYVYFLTIKDGNSTYGFGFNYSTNYSIYSIDADQTILADICKDGLLDLNNNNLSDFLVINISIDVKDAGAYTLETALYDSYSNYVKKIINTSSLNSGMQVIEIRVNGTFIYSSKINGPYTLNYIQLMQGNTTLDYVVEPCTTNISYYDDFERPNLPDLTPLNLKMNQSAGIALIKTNISNIGSSYAFIIKTSFFDQDFNLIKEKFIDYLAPNEKETVSFEYDITNITKIYAIVDYEDETEETNESNNQISSTTNEPALSSINGITAEEGSLVTITANATDPNNDILTYYINDTRFNQSNNIFRWQTQLGDAGVYFVNISVSDGTYKDSQIVEINVSAVEYITFNLSLTAGWHLVSIPVNMTTNALPAPLSSIEGNYSKVFVYNDSKWYMHDPADIPNSNLNSIDEKTGFWIKMNNSDTLRVTGRALTVTNFILKKGMNLISYPSTETKLINETFNVDFENILAYENSSWRSYSKSKPPVLNSLKNMTPGYGYWVKSSRNVTWKFNGTYYNTT